MERGTSSINSLLHYLVFSITPTIIDIIIAIVYFAVSFNIWFGLIILVTMALYLSGTIFVTEWRTKFRRTMNSADNEQRTRGVDSLLNAETVKYYAMEEWETNQYREAIVKYQTEEWLTSASLVLMNLLQSFLMNGGLLSLALYCCWLVSDNDLSVGDFVLLIVYFAQLMGPLDWLGTLYRVIQDAFINMENMFDLMNEKIEIVDSENAMEFSANNKSPEIKFDMVSFGYTPEREVLKDINITIESGTTTALVGASGCGKSTVAKLVLRMFEAEQGKITFDGRNIKDITQASLRKAIGVVPQDTVLFNDTVMFNIKYGRIDATDEEVIEAAKLAEIHDSILCFPEGYQAKVGERGLKLSGGEKQRVAIARTLLKDPPIMIFDEATSSLDSNTEANIQTAIKRASASRTCLVIAHRLSTVVTAEQILVLDTENQGQGCNIVERGSHHQLLELGGR